MMEKGRVTKYSILEAMLVVCLFLVGICMRVFYMPTEQMGTAVFFETASVGAGKTVPYTMGTGAEQVYLYFLRGLFLLLGDIWNVGIIAQIVLLMIGAMIFYFGIRKITGAVGSLILTGILLCAPAFLPLSYSYGTQMLYFVLFSIGMYFTHSFVKTGRKKEECNPLYLVTTVFCGVFAGLILYMDVFGIVLLLPIMILPFLFQNGMGPMKGFGVTVLWIFSMAIAFFLCGFAESLLIANSMQKVVIQWLVHTWDNLWSETHIWLGIFILATYFTSLLYGIVSLIKNKYYHTVDGSVDELLNLNLEEEKVTEEIPDVAEKPVVEEPVVKETSPAVSFIDNPLPLPKKHVKKTLDYAFEPDFEDMDYDIQISDTDDYDIK